MKFKPIYWQFISFSIICFLGFQYWSKAVLLKSTCESLNGINVQLQNDREVINTNANELISMIHKNSEIDPRIYGKYRLQSDKADNAVSNTLRYLENSKKEFVEFCGGWNTTNKVLNKATSNSKSSSFFNENKIKEIKEQLQFANNALTDVEDIQDKEIIKKSILLKNLIIDDKYWNRIQSLPHLSAYTELSNIENLILNDKIFFLNYNIDKVSNEIIIFNKYRVVIAPLKAALIEGEKFEGDIYIVKYSSTLVDVSTITVNGENMPIVNGVAHYISAPQSIGKKIVKFNATLSNPITGEVSTSQGEYEYEVLPKCSRDCNPLSKK